MSRAERVLGGRISRKEESLSKAKEIAEDWHLKLLGKLRSGEIKDEKTFREVSAPCLHEYDIMTQGQRNQRYGLAYVFMGLDLARGLHQVFSESHAHIDERTSAGNGYPQTEQRCRLPSAIKYGRSTSSDTVEALAFGFLF